MEMIQKKGTDERGRVYFGDLAIRQGSGRVAATANIGGSAQTIPLNLRLVAYKLHYGLSRKNSLQLPVPQEGRSEAGQATGSKKLSRRKSAVHPPQPMWENVWDCSVAFSDDGARCIALQWCSFVVLDMLSNKEALAGKMAQLVEERGPSAGGRGPNVTANQGELIEQEAKDFFNSNCGEAVIPVTAGAEASHLSRHALECLGRARFGMPRQGMTGSIQRCLNAGEEEVVGVLAQLATVDDLDLSALLASAFGPMLQIIVVQSLEAIKRLRTRLQENQVPIPSMLSYTMIQSFSGEGALGELPLNGMSPLAMRLRDEACLGSDAPLAMALPHTRALVAMREADRLQRGSALPHDQWPDGCVGYAVNLVRPVIPNHRSSVLYSQIGKTLVFETLEKAAAYRQFVTQGLRYSLGDIYTLDHQKLSGRGVVVGSGFRVLGIQEAPLRFGAQSPSKTATVQSLQQTCKALDALGEALLAKEQLDGAVKAGIRSLQGEEAPCSGGRRPKRRGRVSLSDQLHDEVREELAEQVVQIVSSSQEGGDGEGGSAEVSLGNKGGRSSRAGSKRRKIPVEG
eukprot:gene6659-3323_t